MVLELVVCSIFYCLWMPQPQFSEHAAWPKTGSAICHRTFYAAISYTLIAFHVAALSHAVDSVAIAKQIARL
jgi:hypothetical protein